MDKLEPLSVLGYSLFGFAVVLALLLVLMLIVQLMAALMRAKPVSLQQGQEEGGGAPPPGLPAGSSGRIVPEIELNDVDDKTAAMLIALVCQQSGIPPERLLVRSIRAL